MDKVATLNIDVPGDVNASGCLWQELVSDAETISEAIVHDLPEDVSHDEALSFAQEAWNTGRAVRAWDGCTFELLTFDEES
jgi:hypothetical protein